MKLMLRRIPTTQTITQTITPCRSQCYRHTILPPYLKAYARSDRRPSTDSETWSMMGPRKASCSERKLRAASKTDASQRRPITPATPTATSQYM